MASAEASLSEGSGLQSQAPFQNCAGPGAAGTGEGVTPDGAVSAKAPRPLPYFQAPTSLKYLSAPGWNGIGLDFNAFSCVTIRPLEWAATSLP